MSNIFFDLDGYDTRQISIILDYLINEKLDKIYLLRENHSNDELWTSQIPQEIQIVDCFDNRMSDGDILFTSNTRKHGDKRSKIRIINYFKPEVNLYSNFSYKYFSKSSPTILIVSMGNYVNTLSLEILIGKILKTNNITAYQKFSSETSYFLKCLKKSLQFSLSPSTSPLNNPLVNIIYIDALRFKSAINFMYEMKKLHPGLILICINQDFNNYKFVDYLQELLCPNCKIIQSPYITYETGTGKTIPIYFENENDKNNLKFDGMLESTLKHLIFDSFYVPNTIKIIK